ncbi:MAG: ABC transporter ATP-binding protein [bacterium]|uniref:ABC-type polysaccharide/polyol phosphate transport system, ATPase component n=2 Tax=Bacteria candidate phyla TaxID=1783234 RepID=A0A101I1Z6_UNCT6|nr:MAG: ABC-type polysaccharide/polyol phosphate transport system, ATPase component [candidate division TA06 bacterium 32_111]KUK87527.1 MAG: ABC-type polysaccharide/polyol phosphate transport system, ATPase component [candidate division TA06 bacterium 34_109]MDI6700319.1 ABC transporter ATP-binding protein [bacterium]HAF08137.1 ABC transporter ATP-binding protein [candidate division WOR-3 bacterium]HCP16699.1 ABC transporter ATP-binding protein [candidate division WOR-3 bacterium]
MNRNFVVSLKDVSLTYYPNVGIFQKKKIEALKNISFDVSRNEFFSIIGANGSGKTTLLSIVSKILKPDNGTVRVYGNVSSFLGLGIGFNPELTGKENIFLYGTIMGFSKKYINSILEEIIDFSELENFIDMKVKDYSTGMYVRLGFSVAIFTNPEILIIDEVLAVGDAHFQRKCLEKVENLKSEGTTILFVSHDMGMITRFSDRVALLDEGKIVKIGDPDDVVSTYLSRKENDPVKNVIRRGSRELEITDILCENDKYSSYERKNISLRIKYKKNGKVEKAIFGFAITDQFSNVISGPNIYDYEGKYIDVKDFGELSFSFQPLNLNPGRYYISVAFYDIFNRFPYDHIDFASSFEVLGNRKKHLGFVKIPVNWKL